MKSGSWQSVPGWLLALVFVFASACSNVGTFRVIRSQFAGRYACPKANIEIEDLPGKEARASGCGQSVVYRCPWRYTCHRVEGTERGGFVEASVVAVAPTPAPVAAARAQVATKVAPTALSSATEGSVSLARHADGYTLITAQIPLNASDRVRVIGAPQRDPEFVLFELAQPLGPDAASVCPIGMSQGASPLAVPETHRAPDASRDLLRVKLPVTVLTQLAEGAQPTLSACTRLWYFGADARAQLWEFLARFGESPEQLAARTTQAATTPAPRLGSARLQPPASTAPRPLYQGETVATATDLRHLELRIRELKRRRPGLGGPVNMIVFGSIAAGLGTIAMIAFASDDVDGDGAAIAGFGALTAFGIGLDVGGILLLRGRREERERMNIRIFELKQQRSAIRREVKANSYR